jgi:hypothetical protein
MCRNPQDPEDQDLSFYWFSLDFGPICAILMAAEDEHATPRRPDCTDHASGSNNTERWYMWTVVLGPCGIFLLGFLAGVLVTACIGYYSN